MNGRGRVFLLSPANAGGERARMVLNERATFDLAVALRKQGASLADIFSFVSGLYIRGKITYARRFGNAPSGVPGVFIITPDRGLVSAEAVVTLDDLRQMAAVPVDASESRYRGPLECEARRIEKAAGDCDFVLLGSIATAKYVEPLLDVFGARLLFPIDFVGRGDMSRGGLLLRCAREGVELEYTPVTNAVRHGPRPPKLPKLRGRS
jgi:hypothetical protein